MGDTVLFANNASGVLAAGISDIDVGLTLNSGQGALFPAPAAGQIFKGTLVDTSGNIEIVHATARTADTVTIVRAQEGTTARTFAAGSIFELRTTKGVLEQMAQTKGGAIFEDSPTVPEPSSIGHAVPKSYADGHGFTTGDVKLSIKAVADAGWVVMNDGTIGNASSGATARAHADTESLFTLLWNNTLDSWCAVSGGRGASAAADFAANKTIALPKMLGRSLAVAGAGSGLTSRALAEVLGEETHLLDTNEMPSHNHGGVTNTTGAHGGHNTSTSYSYGTGAYSSSYILGNVSAGNHSHTISSQGGGAAHNNMQPTSFINIHIKL